MSDSIKITWNPKAAAPAASASTTRTFQYSGDPRPASLRQTLAPLARSYQAKVQALAQSIQAFSWPAGGLVAGRSIQADSRLSGALTAALTDPALPYERFVSRGFDPDAASSLAAGDYAFEVSLDGKSETLGVTLEGGETNAQVLDKVAQALNAASTPVQARSLFQSAPGQRLEGSQATGQVLAIDLNPGLSSGTAALHDTRGHLLSSLDFTAVPTSLGPAQTALYTLKGELRASLTSFSSSTKDPGAAAGLAAGTYTLSWSMGADSGLAILEVAAGDTWKAVLERLAGRINLEQTRFTAQTSERERTVYTEDGRVLRAAGLGLTITANQGKLGERLSLSGADAASQALLSALGLNATAQPGTDGRMIVDGTTQVRQPGVFDADQGHVRMTLLESFGETLPLRVTDSLDQLEQGLTDVVTAYNGLRRLLLDQADSFLPGLARDWRGPLQAAAGQLRGLGLRESGREKTLWLDATVFYTVLGQDPEEAQNLLRGSQGLLTTWSKMAARTLRGNPERLLEASALPAPLPLNEVDLERGRKLLDLLEQGNDKESAAGKDSGRLVDEQG